ncbi:hypothetical protein, partial [Bartonella henselae]|uniref:hypothetical protein n=2 Tax=Bartonella henselae TaxID=38323 RepID=UPI0025AB06F9
YASTLLYPRSPQHLPNSSEINSPAASLHLTLQLLLKAHTPSSCTPFSSSLQHIYKDADHAQFFCFFFFKIYVLSFLRLHEK